MTFFTVIWFLVAVIAGVGCAWHALLVKKEPQAALGWMVVCLVLSPFGPVLYLVFGTSRIRSRARKLEIPEHRSHAPVHETDKVSVTHLDIPARFRELVRLSNTISQRPLLATNQIQPLFNGEQAYPQMLDAIFSATESVYLTTFIFETNKIGRHFVSALEHALQRGLDVRVIVDGVGDYYSIPKASGLLKRRKIPFARFLPPTFNPPFAGLNLRNHRKILVVDGKTGFTGGMNIGTRHLVENPKRKNRVQDVHFKVEGPVVLEMESVFLSDWAFLTSDTSRFTRTYKAGPGRAVCRTVVDGPDQKLNRLDMLLVGAAQVARRSIRIMTPYFLPSRELTTALQATALRGVSVTVVLPEKNNLPFVQWAASKTMEELLKHGVRIFFQPPPFTHSKLFILDSRYVIMGSANIDPRSFYLNFEMCLEIFDPPLASGLADHVDMTVARSRELNPMFLKRRSLAVKTRDSLAWLVTPYL